MDEPEIKERSVYKIEYYGQIYQERHDHTFFSKEELLVRLRALSEEAKSKGGRLLFVKSMADLGEKNETIIMVRKISRLFPVSMGGTLDIEVEQ